jgi:F-type H+-transporting ATPase subunit b
MKKTLFVVLVLSPLVVFANENAQTDIIPRVVNFTIFVAIIYFLLADKLKIFFSNRTKNIQQELDNVQITLEKSKKRIEDAKLEVEKAKLIAIELVADAKKDTNSIKEKISLSFDQEVNNLSKSFEGKLSIETKKAKTLIVNEILNELLNDDNMSISQDDLVNIILKKVA